MANDFEVQMAAMEMFRRRFGVQANPENHPNLWEATLIEARDLIDEQYTETFFDEGGEA